MCSLSYDIVEIHDYKNNFIKLVTLKAYISKES